MHITLALPVGYNISGSIPEFRGYFLRDPFNLVRKMSRYFDVSNAPCRHYQSRHEAPIWESCLLVTSSSCPCKVGTYFIVQAHHPPPVVGWKGPHATGSRNPPISLSFILSKHVFININSLNHAASVSKRWAFVVFVFWCSLSQSRVIIKVFGHNVFIRNSETTRCIRIQRLQGVSELPMTKKTTVCKNIWKKLSMTCESSFPHFHFSYFFP